MAEFKKGDRVVFTKDDAWWERGELVARMPAGTLGTYLGTRAWRAGAPWVRLDTGELVCAWATSIAPAEDHGTGDGSASDICAEPGCNCDLERRFPAPLDPSGRHELAADFFHAKTGTAASYFTVDLSPEERAPYYAAADAFLAAQPAPEPEPALPTTVGSVVLVRGMGGDAMALQLRPDRNGRAAWRHALGNEWISLIVSDHLIDVLHDAGEVAR